MKYNLKKLKELVKKTEEQTDFYEIDSSFEAWLVGFEAELRRMLWQIETDEEVKGWNKAIKEILG